MGIGSVGQDARSHIEAMFQYDCEKKEFESSNTLKKHGLQQPLQWIWAIARSTKCYKPDRTDLSPQR